MPNMPSDIPPAPGSNPYVSRGGLKLRHALDVFGIDPAGMVCADLGCSTGGFTDCLLQAGATRIHSVDTAYGELAWKLRQDTRVVVTERTNALHAAPPPGGVNLIVVDLGWTPQRLLIPAALRWLAPGGKIITLIKPHYELKDCGLTDLPSLPRGGVLPIDLAERITMAVVDSMSKLTCKVTGLTKSPVLGGKHKGKGTGNAEWLAMVEPA